MTDYGSATIVRNGDGSLTVAHADDVIGLSTELLGEQPDGMPVDSDGFIWLAGDPSRRYRPVRFVSSFEGGPPTVLVCERVREAAEGVG